MDEDAKPVEGPKPQIPQRIVPDLPRILALSQKMGVQLRREGQLIECGVAAKMVDGVVYYLDIIDLFEELDRRTAKPWWKFWA